MRTFTQKMRQVVLAGMVLAVLATSAGCDELLTPMFYTPDYGGYYGGWDNYGGWGGYDIGYPDYGLYDPTSVIQDVVDYRQDAMDWSANAWDEYIRQ